MLVLFKKPSSKIRLFREMQALSIGLQKLNLRYLSKKELLAIQKTQEEEWPLSLLEAVLDLRQRSAGVLLNWFCNLLNEG